MKFQAEWITASQKNADVAPSFRKKFSCGKKVKNAVLTVTALGVYEGFLNGQRVGRFVLAPGNTSYQHRIQVQTYDVTSLVAAENELLFTVGRGWYSSKIGFNEEMISAAAGRPKGLLLELHIQYGDGTEEIVKTDDSWETAESKVRFSEIYDGESYDASFEVEEWTPVSVLDYTYDTLVPQEGPEVLEQERVQGVRIVVTPEGDTLVDFGQEVTGYVEFTVTAKKGDCVRLLHSEVNDKYGNFYNDNYRAAKAEINYICADGTQTWHPHLTFFGFRYIKLDRWPEDLSQVKASQFTAIAVYSGIRRTGYLNSSNPLLNRFFSNVFWGQRGNFLDIPTDCPQRDERLGWTGDAQVFCKAASYNFNVQKFFRKWLHDLYADQKDADGAVGHIVPDLFHNNDGSAAWGDAACIIPWQMYMTYADKEVLREQFDSMKDWVGYITRVTTTPFLWTGKGHYGDWLGLDAPVGSYKGSSREDFIASAFYAYSTELLVRTGKVLGEDMSREEELYRNIVKAFRETYTEYKTQTEHVVALRFGLTTDPEATVKGLVELLTKAGRMETGFVGTPYLLHVLSDNGYNELAYSLMLRTSYPSWLYPVTKGATTVWEHWDGIMENGDFWSRDMNSFNHYAYGSAIDWVYEEAAGIRPLEPGFAKILVAPKPSEKLEWLEVRLDTVNGTVISRWAHIGGQVRYDITLPVPGTVEIAGEVKELAAGNYVFFA